MEMAFSDWFDPNNIEHLKAYWYLHTKGMWPEGFRPDNVYIDRYWEGFINTKIINAWLKHKLGKGIQYEI